MTDYYLVKGARYVIEDRIDGNSHISPEISQGSMLPAALWAPYYVPFSKPSLVRFCSRASTARRARYLLAHWTDLRDQATGLMPTKISRKSAT